MLWKKKPNIFLSQWLPELGRNCLLSHGLFTLDALQALAFVWMLQEHIPALEQLQEGIWNIIHFQLLEKDLLRFNFTGVTQQCFQRTRFG